MRGKGAHPHIPPLIPAARFSPFFYLDNFPICLNFTGYVLKLDYKNNPNVSKNCDTWPKDEQKHPLHLKIILAINSDIF